jgi:anaerobic selenocysteine-containing dehydrogenase
MVMNPDDAGPKAIRDNEEVRVYNDHGSTVVPVKLSPSVRPCQVIIYNGWDPYQFKDWRGCNEYEPGMVKWLHMAGGYGHLRTSTATGCRSIRIERCGWREKIDGSPGSHR